MKKRYITTLLLALCAFPSLQAGEAYCAPECKAPIGCCDNTGYVFAYGGVSFLDEHTVQIDGDYLTGEYDFGDNFIFGGGVGLRSDFLCGTRFEIEGLFQNRDEPSAVFANGVSVPGEFSTDLSIQALMINVLKEMNLGCITAYAGAGIGLATVDYTITIPGGGPGGSFALSDEDTVLAYQLILGAEKPISDCLSVFAQYKLLGVTEQEFNAFFPLEGDDFITHNLVFGAKVGF
jgi:opacity protein-like surface antigen